MIFNIEKTGVSAGKFSEGTIETPKFEINYPAYFYNGLTINGNSWTSNVPSYPVGRFYNGSVAEVNYPLSFRKIGDRIFMQGRITITPATTDMAMFYVPGPCRPMCAVSWIQCSTTAGVIGAFQVTTEGRVICRYVSKVNSNTQITSGSYTFDMNFNYWVNHSGIFLTTDTNNVEEVYTIFDNGVAGGISWKLNAISYSGTYYTAYYSSVSVDSTIEWGIGGTNSDYAMGKNVRSLAAVAIPTDAKYLKFQIANATIYNSKAITLKCGLIATTESSNPLNTVATATQTISATTSTASIMSIDVSSYAGTSQYAVIMNAYGLCPTSTDNYNRVTIDKIWFTTT